MSRPIIALVLAALVAAPLVAQEHGAGTQEPKAPEQMPSYEGNNCIGCHEQQEGNLGKAVTDWRRSSHALQGVGCDGCHGGDPDAEDKSYAHGRNIGFVGAPRLDDIPYFCGKCHEGIMEKHLGSPHGAQGIPNCVTCHGSHAISRPVPEEIITEEDCSKCHSYEPAAKALVALGKARELVADLDDKIGEIRHIPAVESQLEAVQQDLGLDRDGVVSTFHSFRIGNIEMIGANVDRFAKLMNRLAEREEQRQASVAREIPFIIFLMVFFLLASILGFFVYHGKGTVEPGK